MRFPSPLLGACYNTDSAQISSGEIPFPQPTQVESVTSSTSSTDSREPPLPNSYWVVPDRFAAGEYPSATDPVEAAARLRALLRAGVNHFIDLTRLGELPPYLESAKEEADRLGLCLGWERHPIVDLSVPSSPEQMSGILNAIDTAMDDGQTVYLHCWGGVGRTGTVVGCWLVRHGRTGEEALDQIAEWWKGVEKAWRIPCSPQTPEQREYVRDWTEPSQGR